MVLILLNAGLYQRPETGWLPYMKEDILKKPHLLIVEARFYEDIADEMAKGAEAALSKAGASFDRIAVPGAFEIPGAIRFALDGMKRGDGTKAGGKHYDGFVALGCVIRGETTHYDYVCLESARGLQDLAFKESVPIGYGILTVENDEQAWARADILRGNKGGVVAAVAVEMIRLKHYFLTGGK
jgi:6,7-dimethyl-8-ribityllumazine synthase